MIEHKLTSNQGENGIKEISINPSPTENKVVIRIANVGLPIKDNEIAYAEITKNELTDLIGLLIHVQQKLNKSR